MNTDPSRLELVQRLIAHNSCGCGCSSDTRALIGEAADEIMRLRLEVELQKDDILRYQQANAYNSGEAARMRALIAEWAEADSANDFMADDTAAIRYARAMEALREEANR